MNYRDVMTDPVSRDVLVVSGAAIVEHATKSCRGCCRECERIMTEHDCLATKCIICGHEIYHEEVAWMSSRSLYTCVYCHSVLIVCASNHGPIIVGYARVIDDRQEDII